MRSSNRQYLASVDHLRAYAAVLVLLYHGVHVISPHLRSVPNSDPSGWLYTDNPLSALVVEGHTGVALFMVLSGFIFTIGTLGKDVHYGRFLGNRALRIFPLYLVLVVLGTGAYRKGADLLSVIQSLVGLGNLPGSLALGDVSRVWWAIAVELQFYLLFPLLSRLLTRQGPMSLVKLLAAVTVIRGLVWVAGSRGIGVNSMLYYSLAGRIDQFLMGMLAAWLFVHHRDRFQGWFKLAAASTLALTAIWVFHRSHAYQEGRSLRLVWIDAEGAVWALVILTYVATVSSKGLLSRAIAKVGELSFSIYLLHYLVVSGVVTRHRWIEPTGRPVVDAFLTSALLILPVSVAVSVVTFHGIERPFLRWRRPYLGGEEARIAAQAPTALPRPSGQTVEAADR